MNRMNHRIKALLFWLLPALLGACGGQKKEQAATPSAAVTAPVATAKVATVTEFVDGAGRKMLLAPTSSILKKSDVEQVFVVGPDSIVALRWVSTGHTLGANTIVLGGLEKGETVVVSPAAELREGDRVTTDTHTQDRAKEAQH
jgi:multidrug efflux pump subunit AcrA (membrane-fusion protein)